MSKVLFVNHAYSFPSGWGTAAIDYALAMSHVGINVVSRSIRLNNSDPQLPKEFLKLEKKDADNCDICIQHLLPHHLKFGDFKRNIALCVYESSGLWLNNWASKINMMTELWVPSLYTKKCFREGGVKIPIKIVPHTFDMAKYDKPYDKINHPQLDGNYIFYTIADANVRKNLGKIIQAFHLEFSINEPVSLVVKTGKFGADAQQLFEAIKNDCSQIKEHMKLYTNHNMYKDEFIITDNMTDEQIMSIHNTGHCYVNASHGEAWGIPVFDAMAFGKTIVAPNNMYDYLADGCFFGFDTYADCNLRCNDTFRELGSSRETWRECSAIDIGKCMRKAYNKDTKKAVQTDLYNDMNRLNQVRAKEYSYDKIGNLIKGLLQ